MNKKRIFTIVIPLLLVLGLFALMVFKLMSNKKEAESRVYRHEAAEKTVEKDTSILATRTEKMEQKEYVGTFEANKETRISSEVQGKINQIWVDAGSLVGAGQNLIQLDNSLLKLQLQAVEVQIQGFEADIKRYTILAKAEAIQAVQLEKAEFGLKAALVQKATILEQINKTTLKAPFDGVVIAKLSEEGAFANPTVPLLHIIDIHQLRFTVYVPEYELKNFEIGQIRNIVPDAYPDVVLKGNLVVIGSKANNGNSFPVQFLVQNIKNNSLKAGMFGRIELQKNE